ncbi:APC family permease [Clostridium estertheticum]|uniref:Amino acid permease n=1 Tax=Clostridium estertheticum subsp. estertheticum TaxID=1552 RepID=A0A1J0GC62_9CLOT|nr:APC family permease [Clostridium estertheticum]APC38930.1 amino acid permease [Clostridium estertheticum subsp. estertheticum]MBU3074844.1 APC family permease [Clostridium estertheticum]MBU3165059.1 APC family permease [Clostridium estertheticum]MBU3173650.1 APC family permease [Clostridium estertheticum]MBU3186754.1 APC family permease [Clostridium estertheticum]
METKLEKKYGLITAIAMVVGIVIGSGVFFKAEKVLTATGGNLTLGILAWVIGGVIMISCAYTFAVMATKYEKVNGIVDYAEATMGEKYGYYVGWFMALIYYPTLTSVLAWVSARYTCVLLGFSITGGECMTIACLYLIGSFALNALSPVLSGKFLVSTTVIKLIPLILMAIIGTIVGIHSGMTMINFTTVVKKVNTANALFTAVVATAFAYEGWIIATSINAELKDAKKNLPLALVGGTFIIMVVYILYYMGLAGAVTNQVMMNGGEAGAKLAFQKIFSSAGGTIVFVFVIISCLGTLNGLMLGCTRGIYSLAARGFGPKPNIFKQIDSETNMPTNSSILGLLLCAIWLLYFYGSNLTKWFGFFNFDSSELPIVTIYALYIPIFIMMIKKEKDLNLFKRFVMPIISLTGCVFMIVAACFSHKLEVVAYLIIFAIIMAIGALFSKKQSLTSKNQIN